jgi:hypothetical protein
MDSNKKVLTQRDWLILGTTTFLTSGLLTGLGVMVAAVMGIIKV